MKNRKKLLTGIALLITFLLWTILIQSVDVQAVGVNETKIGFAAVNTWFHKLTGVHLTLYSVTDWLGLVSVCICGFFGIVGLTQLIKRKSIFKVHADIILLGIYYIVVIFAYMVFEMIPINYRPILIDGFMKALVVIDIQKVFFIWLFLFGGVIFIYLYLAIRCSLNEFPSKLLRVERFTPAFISSAPLYSSPVSSIS